MKRSEWGWRVFYISKRQVTGYWSQEKDGERSQERHQSCSDFRAGASSSVQSQPKKVILSSMNFIFWQRCTPVKEVTQVGLVWLQEIQVKCIVLKQVSQWLFMCESQGGYVAGSLKGRQRFQLAPFQPTSTVAPMDKSQGQAVLSHPGLKPWDFLHFSDQESQSDLFSLWQVAPATSWSRTLKYLR